MGLDPEAFWGLTKREFEIKHAAFTRAEDRQRSVVLELALLTGGHRFKKSDQAQMRRSVTALRRYPMKRWLPGPDR